MSSPINKIFGIKEPVQHNFSILKQSAEAVEDFSVKKVILSKEIVTDDHNAVGTLPQVVNVIYHTDAAPPVAANTVPIGTIYVQYTP